jgi:hypothetical protein
MSAQTTRRALLIGALAIGAAACASTSTRSGVIGTFRVGTSYTLTMGEKWADISLLATGATTGVRWLTIDGPNLNSLYATPGLREGQSMIRQIGSRKENPLPAYRPGMSQRELVEMVVDTLAFIGYADPEATNLRPQKFGEVDGVRFEVGMRSSRGLDMTATALIAESNQRAYLLLFFAPSEHYFAATLPEVDKVFASATLKP